MKKYALVLMAIIMALLVPALVSAELQCTITTEGSKIFITVPSASEDMTDPKDGFILLLAIGKDTGSYDGEFLIKPNGAITLKLDSEKRYVFNIFRAYYLPEYGKYMLQDYMEFKLNLTASSRGEIEGAEKISDFEHGVDGTIFGFFNPPYVSGGSDGLIFWSHSYSYYPDSYRGNRKIKVTGYRSCGPYSLSSASVYISDRDQLNWSVLGGATRIEACDIIVDSVNNREIKGGLMTMPIITNWPCG